MREFGITPHVAQNAQSLIADLATLTRNEAVTAAAPDVVLTLYAKPTAIQQKAFDLLAIDPARTH